MVGYAESAGQGRRRGQAGAKAPEHRAAREEAQATGQEARERARRRPREAELHGPPAARRHAASNRRRLRLPRLRARARSATRSARREATIASGWHHGEDIFGQLGAPLLAVADGTIFSVGWNDIGGYRLWLRDQEGNEFYYAHLSAYSPFAVNGRQVKAGTVIGFMGNTGDAETTPYHLHFEIHPVGMLYLGYDGAVGPYPYLMAWRRLEDVEFAQVAGWAPPVSATSTAPKPGAILLSSSDISTADGLDPGSLERALDAPTAKPARSPRGNQGGPLVLVSEAQPYFALSCRYSNSSPSPKILSWSQRRVPGPVTGLKRMPRTIPVRSSVAFRPPCDCLPWTRSAASRRSSIASRRLCWISLSVATRAAAAVNCAPAEQLVVDVARGRDRALHVLADALVLECTLEIGLHVARPVLCSVLKLGHLGSPFGSLSRRLYPALRGLQTA